MQESATTQKEWKEVNYNYEIHPKKYSLHQSGLAVIDLLKSLFTKPYRAMEFPLFVYFKLFMITLIGFSCIHSILVILTANFSNYEFLTFLTGCTRIFLSTSIALVIATPGIVLLWVITPEISFNSTFKRFLLYYESVILFSLLGELFFSKFIIDSSMKIQPLIVFMAGTLAIKTLHDSLAEQPNIQITRMFIVGILIFSYLQSFLIVDGLIEYHLQDNIDSPVTIFIKNLFGWIFN
ncbi:MAG: hypothetical protein HeimC3_35360 [Candidatus Heimdallarchaeota archaeon LC_3]|nr:MAG: hypothetical protein HeimC3_35360 [Candidatus Heimdallarchaeota archaeon LC_3]